MKDWSARWEYFYLRKQQWEKNEKKTLDDYLRNLHYPIEVDIIGRASIRPLFFTLIHSSNDATIRDQPQPTTNHQRSSLNTSPTTIYLKLINRPNSTISYPDFLVIKVIFFPNMQLINRNSTCLQITFRLSLFIAWYTTFITIWYWSWLVLIPELSCNNLILDELIISSSPQFQTFHITHHLFTHSPLQFCL